MAKVSRHCRDDYHLQGRARHARCGQNFAQLKERKEAIKRHVKKSVLNV
jgi:hypothetical protein